VPDDTTEIKGLNRSRDLGGWLLTPVVALVVGPAVAASVGILQALFTGVGDQAALCESAAADNRCEEVTLVVIGQHATLFGVLWLLLWLVPWWRGLRSARIALAVVACLVLVALPLRMGVSAS
jgi:L-cystine uptake protein TcyP (sodium:dicarboxylate symporter family)